MTTWIEDPPGSGLMYHYPVGGDVCPSRWERSFARGDITTRVILDRSLPLDTDPIPNPIVANDTAAQSAFGIEPYERLDLWTLNDADMWQIAGRILATRAAGVSMPRIKGVEIDASTSDDALDLLTLLSIWDPTRVRGRLQTDRGLVFDAEFFAVGVTHDISAEGWIADISLDRSTPYELLAPGDYLWDVGLWDRSLWN